MSESIIVPTGTKPQRYTSLLAQVESLVEHEDDFVANVANIMAALKQVMGFFWVGCYFVKGNELVLGPFQGPVACTRIREGKGVCGTAWMKNTTIIVPDVELFPGHIACSSESKSEIVIPIRDSQNVVIGVLDVDSEFLNHFDIDDQNGLERIVKIIERCNTKNK